VKFCNLCYWLHLTCEFLRFAVFYLLVLCLEGWVSSSSRMGRLIHVIALNIIWSWIILFVLHLWTSRTIATYIDDSFSYLENIKTWKNM
jgi:hypothetical protein